MEKKGQWSGILFLLLAFNAALRSHRDTPQRIFHVSQGAHGKVDE